eukprot:10327335-Alexandrium_andersonii.AAC.1
MHSAGQPSLESRGQTLLCVTNQMAADTLRLVVLLAAASGKSGNACSNGHASSASHRSLSH